VEDHLGLRRDLAHVGRDLLGQPLVLGLMDEVEARDQEVLVTRQVDRGPPALPALRTRPGGVERDPQEGEDDDGLLP
jgi:hypothetical protein